MLKKILISIAALISILLFCHLIVYNYNSYKLSSDPQIQADYLEAQSRIQEFKNSIKLPPENISKEENGHYWYSEAFKTMPKENRDALDKFVDNFRNNPEKASFKDKEMVKYLDAYENAFKLIEKGNKCKYFDFAIISDNVINKSPHFISTRTIVEAYSLKASCYVNDGQYTEACETLHECFTFIKYFFKNAAIDNKKYVISFVIEMAMLKRTYNALSHLLKISDKPYPVLLSDVKSFLNDMSISSFKELVDFDLTTVLIYIDGAEKGKDAPITIKDNNREITYYIGTDNKVINEENKLNYKFLKLYNSLYFKKVKSSTIRNYKIIISKITNDPDLTELEISKEESEKDYVFTDDYFIFQKIPNLSPNISKVNYTRIKTIEFLNDIENQLEARENL